MTLVEGETAGSLCPRVVANLVFKPTAEVFIADDH